MIYYLQHNRTGFISKCHPSSHKGLPCKRLFVGILMITMWIAVSATTLSYLTSVNSLSFFNATFKQNYAIRLAITISLYTWLVLMLILLLIHFSRIIVKLTKKLAQLGKKMYQRSFTRAANHPSM